jgi:hypothetical protein
MDPNFTSVVEKNTTVARLSELVNNSAVLEAYAKLFNEIYEQIQTAKKLKDMYWQSSTLGLGPVEKIAVVRQLSRILESLKKWCEDEEQNIYNQVSREGRGFRDSDVEILEKLKRYKETCATELEKVKNDDPEVQIQLRKDQITLDRLTLKRRVPEAVKKRSRGLAKGAYIETQDRKEIIYGREKSPEQSITAALRKRHNVELFGPTGTGKTQMGIQAARVYSGKEPVIVSGERGLSRYTFLGQLKGSNSRYEGALVKALKDGRVLLVDEDNRIEPDILAVIKFALGLKVGDVWEHPDTGEQIKVPAGFGIIVTRNERGKHHKDRFDLPPEYRREFTHASFEIGYFPKEEMYERFLLPQLTLDDGSMNVTASEVGGNFNKAERSPLLSFAVAAEEIQQLYTENKIEAVFESGFMIDFFDDWQEQHIRTGCNFIQYMETRLMAFVHRPINIVSKKEVIRVLIQQGFFQGKGVNDFQPKEGDNPVAAKDLTEWRKGSSAAFDIKETDPKLSSRDVALLDPFDRRKVVIKEHKLKNEINAFNGAYMALCGKKGMRPVSFSPHNFASKKAVIVNSLKAYIQANAVDNAAMLEGVLDSLAGVPDEEFMTSMSENVFPYLE